MTKRVGSVFIIAAEQPQQCDFCGKVRELRPYGPNGEKICFECAMKDPDTTRRKFLDRLEGRTNG